MIENLVNNLIKKQIAKQQASYEYIFLDWDTDYFGVKSSRVILHNKINKGEWLEIRDLIFRSEFIVIDNVNNDSVNNFYLSNLSGIFLTDINFQFIKAIDSEDNENISEVEEKNIFVQNNMRPNSQLIEISKNSYKYSRFFNDPFLDKVKSKNIYSHWVESAFLNEDKYFLYYKSGGNIQGYLLFRLDSVNNIAIIELISVKEGMKNKSIGTHMIKYLEKYLKNDFSEIDKIKVGTQSNNTRAINFYIKNGFRVKELRSIYHYWPNFILNNMDVAVNDEIASTN